MDVTLYKNFSVPLTLNKNITVVATYPAMQLVEPVNDADVSIRMTVPTDTLKWDNVNYFSFDGAYYFLESVDKTANGISTINGSMDLLMTYRAAIAQLRVKASRSTSHGTTRVEDALRTISVDSTRTVVTFPNQISGTEAMGRYVLVTSQNRYRTS